MAAGDKEMAIARVYSGALLKLAAEAKQEDAVREELADLVAFIGRNANFAQFLFSPTVDAPSREKTLEKLFRGRYSDVLVNTLLVLNRKERLALLSAMGEAFEHQYVTLKGRVEVYVRSAAPLTDAQREKVKQAASEKLGAGVALIETVDPALLGGLVVVIGDDRFDMSVASRLGTIRASLVERAVRESHSGRSFVAA